MGIAQAQEGLLHPGMWSISAADSGAAWGVVEDVRTPAMRLADVQIERYGVKDDPLELQRLDALAMVSNFLDNAAHVNNYVSQDALRTIEDQLVWLGYATARPPQLRVIRGGRAQQTDAQMEMAI